VVAVLQSTPSGITANGWTLVTKDSTNDSATISVYTKTADGSHDTGPSYTDGYMRAFAFYDTAGGATPLLAPVSVVRSASYTTGSLSVGSVNMPSPGVLLTAWNNFSSNSSTITLPSGSTVQVAPASNAAWPAGYQAVGASATGTRTASFSVNGYNVGAAIGVYPANTAPNAPTLNAPATNATIDRASTQRFAWTFSDPNPGDSQSKFDLQYRVVNTTTWTTVSSTTPNTFYDFAAGTFAAGDYEWQVRTYDAQGLVGPWSSSGFFTAADAPSGPTITAPVNGATIGGQSFELDWSYPSQDAFQAQLLDGSGAIVTDLGVTNSTTTRAVSFGNIPNNVTRTAQVRVESGGLWSAYSAVTVTISYTPPAAPTLTLTPDDAAGTTTVGVANPTPGAGVPDAAYNDVYCRTAESSPVVDTYRPYSDTGTRIATEQATNTAYVDRNPASSPVVYEYRVVSVATNGTTSDSGWVSTG
jgi:hypothetical protein